MTKFMTCENWFIKQVICEICQNLHVTWGHAPLPPLLPQIKVAEVLNLF